jgi:ATP-dependent Clp protease ATP-binding subunit ClpC
VVNFKNTVIILTSNIGAEYIDNMEKLGFYESGTDNNQYADAKKNVEKALKQNFRPEFLNRLDDIIIFDILEQDTIKKIVSLQIEEVKKRVLDKNINLKVTDAVINFLAKEGYDPHYGARPVKRVIQNRILNQLAKLIITKNLVSNDSVTVNIKGKDFSFDVKKGKKSRLYQENDVKEAVLVN